MRIIVAGGRDFDNYYMLKSTMDSLAFKPTSIVSGTAKGADKLGERWADECAIDVERYPADWNRFGKSAGYRRNQQMAQNAEALVAFWDGKSKGTQHMIKLAISNGLWVKVIRYNSEKRESE